MFEIKEITHTLGTQIKVVTGEHKIGQIHGTVKRIYKKETHHIYNYLHRQNKAIGSPNYQSWSDNAT